MSAAKEMTGRSSGRWSAQRENDQHASPRDRQPAPMIEELSREECLALVSGTGIGWIGYVGRYGPVALPVNYRLHDGRILFRTSADDALSEDPRTGITGADYHVAFEVDVIDATAREGWSVLIQGPAHHVDEPADRAATSSAGLQPWPGGDRELCIRIIPARINGRRVRQAG